MHKDKPPGLFDFAERSIRYLVGFWFTAGLILSLLVHTEYSSGEQTLKGVTTSEIPTCWRPRRMPVSPPPRRCRHRLTRLSTNWILWTNPPGFSEGRAINEGCRSARDLPQLHLYLD